MKFKFRIWNGYKIYYNPSIIEIQKEHKDKESINDLFDIQKFKFQQYTGVKDKNGKEIYEGDIVSVLDENNVFDVRFGNVKRNIVGFDTNTIYPIEISCFYFHRDGLPHFSITKNHLGKHDLEDTEVIGNIFENSELLK